MTTSTLTDDQTGFEAPAWLKRPYGHLMIWSIQSPINMGMILRVAEGFQLSVSVYDPGGLFEDEARMKTVSDFSCGALQRVPPTIIREQKDAISGLVGGRVLATSIGPRAKPLSGFRFRRSDQIVLGSEYDGLPQEVMDNADEQLNIPMPEGYLPKPKSFSPIDPGRSAGVSSDGTPNLNVAMSAGILCHRVYMQGRAIEKRRAG